MAKVPGEIVIKMGFGMCGDRSPSGVQVCNRDPRHVAEGLEHWFVRGGQLITTWPLAPGGGTDSRPLVARMSVELEEWWLGLARVEAEKVVPKAVEYGATDLRDIGRDLAAISGRTVTDEEATELGIYFYLRGKLSRWTDAVIRGDRPSDDTLHDLGVYVRMAQRTRSHGGWPGINKEDAK